MRRAHKHNKLESHSLHVGLDNTEEQIEETMDGVKMQKEVRESIRAQKSGTRTCHKLEEEAKVEGGAHNGGKGAPPRTH